MILKHVGWSVVVFGSIPKSNFWSVDCTQVSDSGPLGLLFTYVIYCKLVIIRHVSIFAIFVSALNDEFTYWRIYIPMTICKWLLNNYYNSLWKKVLSCMLYKSFLHLWFKHRKWEFRIKMLFVLNDLNICLQDRYLDIQITTVFNYYWYLWLVL